MSVTKIVPNNHTFIFQILAVISPITIEVFYAKLEGLLGSPSYPGKDCLA